ncbi:hypothetical protein MKX68_27980 [Paenibacillus sp. FSL M8-0212]|uniref:hypothetical protein n=1 Tax=Paenibacillus sp. FSL M8-0212 TaxID=2921618 RepID=UPI0030FCE00A
MHYKKFACAVLAASLLLPTSSQVFAGIESISSQSVSQDNVDFSNLDSQSIEEVMELPKDNISFIKGNYGDQNIEYTYTSAGREWKAVENSSSDYKELHSEIYLKNDNGDYELFTTMDVKNISATKIDLTFTPENGKASYNETIDMTFQPAGVEILDNQPQERMSITAAADNPSGLPISDWNHYGNFFYNTKVTKYTISFVTNIVVGLVSYSTLGIGGVVVTTAVTNLVSEIVKDNIPDLWYTDKVYYKTVVPPEPGMFRMKVAEKTIHTFYSDSARTKHVKGSPITTEVWLRGYK